jgi:hypothetical protein
VEEERKTLSFSLESYEPLDIPRRGGRKFLTVSNKPRLPIGTKMKIPKLYETENVSLEEKIIHQKYHIEGIGFYWLIAELDSDGNLAFGYANLNDDEMAEWGYIHIPELLSNGAVLDDDWKPCPFSLAKRRIVNEGEEKSQG